MALWVYLFRVSEFALLLWKKENLDLHLSSSCRVSLKHETFHKIPRFCPVCSCSDETFLSDKRKARSAHAGPAGRAGSAWAELGQAASLAHGPAR